MHTTERVSLLNTDDQRLLSNLGTVVTSSEDFQNGFGAVKEMMTGLGKTGLLGMIGITEEQLQTLATVVQQSPEAIKEKLNAVGQHVVDAFDTDTRNMWAGSVMLTQPVFMGGSIVALNRLADLNDALSDPEGGVSRQPSMLPTRFIGRWYHCVTSSVWLRLISTS